VPGANNLPPSNARVYNALCLGGQELKMLARFSGQLAKPARLAESTERRISRQLRKIGPLLVLVSAAATLTAQVQPRRAGAITALRASTVVNHKGIPSLQGKPVNPGDQVFWEDRLRTDKKGRARITLDDKSMLSLGSDSELIIEQHDAQSQRTFLELLYGKIRCRVTQLTGGGKFQLQTPEAVAGVLGTDFGADSSVPGMTKFICLSGTVLIVPNDPTLSPMTCQAGNTVTVKTGAHPATQPATPEQLERWKHIAEPDQ
jgi:ferric-dicitrate binding protein FerR (iron transport regulator)